MLDERRVEAYLKRLAFDKPITCDRATLDALTFAHQCSIPFETVTLHRSGRAPSLEVDAIFDKVVTRRLGGYCFELNKIFEELLRALGFDARPALCRAVRGRDGRMPINHRGIMATTAEGVFSVDVGFGGPMPAGALLLEDGAEQVVSGETYTPRKTDSSWWEIERTTRAQDDLYDDAAPEHRQIELELCSAHVEDVDFGSLNLFFSQPGTLFRDHEVVNLRTPNGYLGYKDNVLTIRENGQKTLIGVEGRDEVERVLNERFGLADIDGYVRSVLA